MKKSFKDYLITITLIALCTWSAWNFIVKGGSSSRAEILQELSATIHEELGSQKILDELDNVGSTQTKPVVLFVTSWCGVCRTLEKALQREKIHFIVLDIESSKAAEKYYVSIMGPKSGPVPVALVGSQVFVGDQSRAIISTSRAG